MIKMYSQKKREDSFDLLFLMLMLVVMISMVFIGVDLKVLESTYAMTNFIICYICVIFSVILYICCMTSETSDRRLIVLFELMIFLLVCSSLLTETYVAMNGKVEYSAFSFTLMTFDILISIAFLTLFWFYQARCLKNLYKFSIANIIHIIYMAIFALLTIINIFHPIIFYIDEEGFFQYPNSGTVTFILDSFWTVFYIFNMARLKTNRRAKLYYIGYIFFPISLAILSFVWVLSEVELRFDSTLCVGYLIPLYLMFFKMYQEQNKLLRDKEKELSEKNMQMMLSQIQPHFLYNALSAISAIPNTPDETRDALSDFGKYLRGNLNSINVKAPIPFIQEIKHVDTYLGLEKLRFGDKLLVEYEFNEREFSVPALSVQMFVENAVKHGITKKEKGGKLLVKTELIGKNYVLTIEDNGVGFNVGELEIAKSDVHIGIANAKSRIKNMVNGTVDIKSEIGEGTVVTITIPKTEGIEK